MRALVIFLLFPCVLSSAVTAQDTANLQPDSLLNWLRIVELDGIRLIHATETDESYFAVSRDREGDLFVAYYAKVPLPENAKRKVSVVDPDTGQSVADYSRDKVNLKTANVIYHSSSQFGPIKSQSSMSVAVDTGWLVPLQRQHPKTIRVRYAFDVGDETITRIDISVTLPNHDRTKR